MMRLPFALLCVAILVAGSACSNRPQPGGAQPVDRETLRPEEFDRNFYSAFEAVQALRPLWLTGRVALDATVQVYVDDNRFGGPEALRTIRIASIAVIRHLDGIQATARYGRGHEGGAILVTTRAAGR
jgi:hypothetical protein